MTPYPLTAAEYQTYSDWFHSPEQKRRRRRDAKARQATRSTGSCGARR